MKILAGFSCALPGLLLALTIPRPVLTAGACADIARLALPNVTITAADAVEAGKFSPNDGASARGRGGSNEFSALPAFCRVAATLKPSSDSDVKVEVWLPAAGWNGKYQAVGNGAFNGSIAYPAMARALAQGYATSSTDTGHTGNNAEFALGHPEKLVDFGWRAVHEVTVMSKKTINAYYDAAPKFSYWNGCSAGGRQGLKEAQKFPEDFNGIIAGAPGVDWTGRAAQALRIEKATLKPEARILQPQRQLLHRAVVEACDLLDGVKDGLIENPPRCKFDPAALECKTEGQSGCLTKAQVETAKLIYSAGTNSKIKRTIDGLLPGSELGWTDTGWTASARASGLDQFRFIVFANPAWTVQQFDFDADIVRADDVDMGVVNALETNLKPFLDRGGKIIQYHGWADPQISPGNSINYYTRAVEANGGAQKVSASYRLFMAPGMAHCSGGEGPNTFDMLPALEAWVEQGKAPDQITASHSAGGRVDRTRPLCPYPQEAGYKGTGSIDEAAAFACQAR